MAAGIVDRALDVIELLVDHPSGIPLSDVARTLDMPKSATHRVLSLLVRRGYVEQPDGLDRYRLNLKLSSLGARYIARTNVLEICQPILDRLAAETGEFVRMALWDGSTLTWVAKAQGARTGLRYDPDMGNPVILHATASGRAWLGTLDEESALAIVREKGFGVPSYFCEQRVNNETDLLRELRLTKKRGYALAVEEGEPGAAAVAEAIPRGEARHSPGTISVAGPVVRMSGDRQREIVRLLVAAQEELGNLWPIIRMRLGWGE